MLNLYFGNLFSVLTIVFVAAIILFIVLTLKNRNIVKKWGKLIWLFILVGTAISAFSAIRDSYAAPGALFAMDSIESTICSIAGGAIFLTGIISLFLRNQIYKKRCFYILSVLFTCMVLVIEVSRVIILL